MDVRQELLRRFAAPLPEYYTRRIVVFRDDQGGFAADVEQMELPGVRILVMREDEWFTLRRQIESDYAAEDILLYCPKTFARWQDNWLADVFKYSEIFRADYWSLLFEELHIADGVDMRRYARKVGRFFPSRDRVAKLGALGKDYRSEQELEIGVMSVLCGLKSASLSGVLGAAVLGAHMEAPFLCEKYKGAQLGECLMNPSVEAYEAMTRGTDCVRMMTLAPELPGALDMVAYLKARGVVTCAAHSNATAEEVHAAADRGLTQITHLFNAQSPLHHRKPGVPGAGLADERIIVQTIADGLHLHPDTLRIAALCKGAKGMALISDSMEAAGMPDGQYDLGGQAVFVKNGEARLADGVIAGSTLVLHRAIHNMITLAKMPPETVIPMATSTPADSVGAKGYGRIEPGACGVLTLMDAGWNLAGVTA